MIKLILCNKQDSQLCKYMHDMVHMYYPLIQQVPIALNEECEKINKINYVNTCILRCAIFPT